MDVPIMIFMGIMIVLTSNGCSTLKQVAYSYLTRIAFTHTIFTGPMINLYVRTSHAVITKSGMHPVYDVYRPSKYWRESISLQMVVKSYL